MIKFLSVLTLLSILSGCSGPAFHTKELKETRKAHEKNMAIEKQVWKELKAEGYHSMGFHGINFGYPKEVEDTSKIAAIQLEIVSIELAEKCDDIINKNIALMEIISPFWDSKSAYWAIKCDKPLDNKFMKNFAAEDGWVHPNEFPEELKIAGKKPMPPKYITWRINKPAKVKLQWRWKMEDGSITEWKSQEFKIAAYEKYSALKTKHTLKYEEENK